MADTSQLEAALVNADKAGDTEAAKTLAVELRRVTAATTPQAAGNAIQPGAQNFAEEMSFPQQMLAGVGSTLSGLGTGIRQLASPYGVGTEKLRQDVAEQRRLDAPLMATPGGRVGELAGNIATTVPTMAIPGVNTVRGAALLGGVTGLIQPSASTGETVGNVALGTALGGAGQGVANKLVWATAPVVKTTRDAILAKAHDLGFVVSPSEGRGTVVNKLMTGLGNKQQMAQQASIQNAGAVEKIAKADLGVPEAEALTPETFRAVRAKAYQEGYKPVESLNIVRSDPEFEKSITGLMGKESQGKVTRAGQGQINELVGQVKSGQWTGKQLVDDIRTLREEGNSNIIAIKDIGQQQLGRAQLEAANQLESLAERNLTLNKAPADTIQNFRAARATIAKAHTIEDSMAGTSELNAAKFAKNENDARKLSPEMYAAWKFAKEFPKSNQPLSKVGGVPWNVYGTSALMGTLGYQASEAAGHGPAGIAMAALPFVRGPARSLAMSNAYQGAMVNPATAIGPRLAQLGNAPARRLQRIAPQLSATTAMEIE